MSAEWDEQDWTHDERVRAALDDIANHIASYKAAVVLGEPDEVLDQWSDRTYAQVDELLSHEDLMYVVIRVMDAEAEKRAWRLLGQMQAVATDGS